MRILVIEDNKQYQEVAQKSLSDHDIVFAETFVEAIQILKDDENGAINGIICDLFFPHDEYDKIGKNGRRLVDFIEKHRQDPNFHDYHPTPPMTIKETGEELAPLGLQVLRAMPQPLPLVFFTQGDRHHGAFGFVRTVLFSHLGLEYLGLFVNDGGDCDKCNPKQWRSAVAMLHPHIQLDIWRSIAYNTRANYLAKEAVAYYEA